MHGRRGRAAMVATVLVLGGLVVVLVRESHDPTGAGRPAASDTDAVELGHPVRVESGTPRTSFLPLGSAPRDGRTFSAQHAYNALVLSPSKLSPIPPTVHPYYGLLTDAAAAPRVVHVRVWGFAVESDCHAASSAATSSTRCRLWEFVDARTGHDLGFASQRLHPD